MAEKGRVKLLLCAMIAEMDPNCAVVRFLVRRINDNKKPLKKLNRKSRPIVPRENIKRLRRNRDCSGVRIFASVCDIISFLIRFIKNVMDIITNKSSFFKGDGRKEGVFSAFVPAFFPKNFSSHFYHNARNDWTGIRLGNGKVSLFDFGSTQSKMVCSDKGREIRKVLVAASPRVRSQTEIFIISKSSFISILARGAHSTEKDATREEKRARFWAAKRKKFF